MQKSYIYSIADGICQGVLVTVILNYIASSAWSYSGSSVPWFIFFATLSVCSALIFLRKVTDNLKKSYLLRSIYFILICVLYFVNQITVQLWMFPVPQRELADAEGIVIFISVFAFASLFVAESIFGAIRQHKRSNHS